MIDSKDKEDLYRRLVFLNERNKVNFLKVMLINKE